MYVLLCNMDIRLFLSMNQELKQIYFLLNYMEMALEM